MPGRFWKIYLVCVTVVSCLIAVGFATFYNFIASYEDSQPENAVKQYTSSISNADYSNLLRDAVPTNLSPYETKEAVLTAFSDALEAVDGKISARKDFNNYSADAPAYSVYKANTEIAKLRLSSTPSGSFGMNRWYVSSQIPILGEWAPKAKSYKFCVPSGAVLTLNGIEVPNDAVKETTVPYIYKSTYEQNEAVYCDIYEISGLYTVPEVICTLNGEVCALEAHETTYFIRYPQSSTAAYDITVPEGSSVSVNGIQLTENEISATDVLYAYHPLEKNAEALPTAITYTVDGLFNRPNVTVTLDGIEIQCTAEGTAFTAAYPESRLYTCEIRVPAGSEVSVYGQTLDPAQSVRESVFPELLGLVDNIPEYDVYTVSGLYASPAAHVTVISDGTALSQSCSTDEHTEMIHAAYPVVEQDEIASLAYAFTKDYITYTSQGYNNIDANLQRALSYVLYGTNTYQRIASSRIGIWYVTPVTSNEYRNLEVTQIMQYSDNMYRCTVAFDVAQQTYYVHNDYSGSIELVFAKKYGSFRIVDMYLYTD